MLTEQVLNPIFSDIDPNAKTVSIAKITVILKDGIEVSRSEHRCAFAPGQIEDVMKYVGTKSSPEMDYLNAIWTPSVIAAYNELISNKDSK
jgi:hypothetical protein